MSIVIDLNGTARKGVSVTTIDRDGDISTYSYAPHPGRFAELTKFYAGMISEGEIVNAFVEIHEN